MDDTTIEVSLIFYKTSEQLPKAGYTCLCSYDGITIDNDNTFFVASDDGTQDPGNPFYWINNGDPADTPKNWYTNDGDPADTPKYWAYFPRLMKNKEVTFEYK